MIPSGLRTKKKVLSSRRVQPAAAAGGVWASAGPSRARRKARQARCGNFIDRPPDRPGAQARSLDRVLVGLNGKPGSGNEPDVDVRALAANDEITLGDVGEVAALERDLVKAQLSLAPGRDSRPAHLVLLEELRGARPLGG